MKSFNHATPAQRIVQGDDCLAVLAHELDRAGSRRAVVFCGATLARPGSALDAVRQALGARCASVYAGVRPDTPLPAVEQAVAELRRLDADAVVAVGGGSALTTARATVILLAERGHARDLCTKREPSGRLVSPKLLAPKLPVFNVPSTPSTAAVKAGSALLDPQEGRRLALFDPKARARAVFIHPAVVGSAPRTVFLSAALNTLALAVEGLLSRRGDPLSDAMLIHSVRLIARQLAPASSGDDPAVRADLMAAAVLCGQGSDHTGAGMAIPIGHAISTRFHVDMGISDAVMLPHVLRFNAPAARAGVEKLALALDTAIGEGESFAEPVVAALHTLFASLGLPRRLRDVGVTREALTDLAAISFDDWYLQSNPRPLEDAGEVRQVLEQAW